MERRAAGQNLRGVSQRKPTLTLCFLALAAGMAGSGGILANPAQNEAMILIECARSGSIDEAERVIKGGISVNSADEAGKTALHHALQEEQADMCLWLLSKGADPWISDRNGADCSEWAEEVMVGEDFLGKVCGQYGADGPPPDIAALAQHLGIPREEHRELLWIAEAALKAPLPCTWAEHTNAKGEVFYYNAATAESTWEHPMDSFFKLLTARYRQNDKHAKSGQTRVEQPAATRPVSNVTSASRLSTASTAAPGYQPSKHMKEGRLDSIAQQLENDGGAHAHDRDGGQSNMGQDPKRKERERDVVKTGYGGEAQESELHASSLTRGAEEYAVRARTSAWGSSKLRAHTASQVQRGEKIGEAPRGVTASNGAHSKGRTGDADKVKMASSHGSMADSRSPAIVKTKEWTREDEKRTAESMMTNVNAFKASARKIKDIVESSSFTDVNSGALISAALKMMKGVDQMDRAAKEAETQAKREYSKREALKSTFESLKGNISVMCRVRRIKGNESTCSFPLEDTISVADRDVKGAVSRKKFAFDRIFEPEATQTQVFQAVMPVVSQLMQGSNVCIFAYGQTGTGKTYTMEGPVHDPGIHYRAVRELFKESDHQRQLGVDCTFKLTVLEIYNERVFDLLVDPRTAAERRKNKDDLAIKFDAQSGVRVDGVTHITVDSVENVIDIIELAGRNRCIGVTSANEHSSRSHLIVTLTMSCKSFGSGQESHSKLHLVDLAGSERQSKTKAQGGRMIESNHINKSLSALHDVITALSNKDQHIPYRNSKLTQMLQDSLSGNSQVLMLVTVSPRTLDVKETVSSLMLAKRVRSIEFGGAKKDVENSEYDKIHKENKVEIEQLQSQVATLEGQLKVALGAAGKTQNDIARRNHIGSKKHEEDRRRWYEERDEMIKATEAAKAQAKAHKEKLDAILQQQQQKQQQQAAAARDDVSIAPSNASCFGDGGGRLDSWRLRVAELSRAIEDKENQERDLKQEIKTRTTEAADLKERLEMVEKKLERPVVNDIISNANDGRSLYERLNDPPKLVLPPKPPSVRVPQAPHTDRPALHRRNVIRQGSGGGLTPMG